MSFAGVSVVADGKLLQAAAYSGTAGRSGYHMLVVEGYSHVKDTPNEKCIKSRSFSVGGYRWVLKFYPNGSRSGKAGFVAVYLVLDQDVAQPVKVHRQFSFIDEVDKQVPARIRAIKPCDFSYSGHGWGHRHLIKAEDLENSKHLKEDCLTLRCDLIVVEPAAAPFIDVPPSNICEHLNHLLADKVGVDVTFEIGRETFTAHWCVLAARSTVFKAELFGPMKEGTTAGAIQIEDMEPDVFEALLGFIYTDSIPKMEVEAEEEGEDHFKNVTWLRQLLAAADRFDLERLKLMCEERLSGCIDLSSVAAILGVAVQHHCCVLKEACLEFLKVQSAGDLGRVMATSDWEHIAETSHSVLNELIVKFASKL